MLYKDFSVNSRFIVGILLFVPFIYVLNKPDAFIVTIPALVFNTFYLDHKNKSNRFLISLPIDCRKIILNRYVFYLFTTMLFLLYLWIIDAVVYGHLPYLEQPAFNLKRILIAFIFINIIIAIIIPILYYTESSIFSFFFQMLIIVLLLYTQFSTKNYPYISESGSFSIFNQSILVVSLYVLCSIICLLCSFLLSTKLLIKKDF